MHICPYVRTPDDVSARPSWCGKQDMIEGSHNLEVLPGSCRQLVPASSLGHRSRVRVYTYIHICIQTCQLWPTGSVGPGAQGQ